MNLLRTSTHALAITLAIASVPLLAACNRPAAETGADAETAEATEPSSFIGQAIERELEQARKELHEGNLVLNGEGGPSIRVNGKQYGGGTDGDNLPKAEITPGGDFLVDGKAVAIDDAERALLLDYRGGVIAVAEAGIAIGGKGVDLAGTAMQQAVGAIFSGNTDQLEQRIEAEAGKLGAEATALCQQLPPLLATQQQLAASLPEFKPYADMTQADVDECLEDLEEEQ